MIFSRYTSKLAAALALVAGLVLPAIAQEAPPLLSNGNFEADKDADGWPDDWGHLKEASWQKDGDKHFLRLTSPEPGKLVLLYRPVNIPNGTRALELNWRQRVSDLKPGKQAWFDARIMLDFKDAAGEKLKGAPGAP